MQARFLPPGGLRALRGRGNRIALGLVAGFAALNAEVASIAAHGATTPRRITLGLLSALTVGMALHWHILISRNSRRSVRAALIESLERVPLPSLILAANGEPTDGNRRYAALLGAPDTREAIARWSSALHPEDRARVVDALRALAITRAPSVITFRLRRAEGGYRWVDAHLGAMDDRAADEEPGGGRAVLVDVDQRKQVEHRLRDNERSLQTMIDAVPTLLWRTDATGDVNYVNQRCIEFHGETADDHADTGWANLCHPEERQEIVGLWQEAIRSVGPFDHTYRFRRRDGVYRWMRVRAAPLLATDGRVLSWYGIHSDVTDQKDAEEALAASERELRLLIDTIPAMLWRTDAGGTVDYISRRCVEQIGLALDDYAGDAWLERVHPDDRSATEQGWDEARHASVQFETLYRYRFADGRYRWTRVSAAPVCDPATCRAVRWFGIHVDVDQQVRAEEALRESERNLRIMIDAVPGMLLVLSAKGQIESANRPFLEAIGLEMDALRDRPAAFWIQPPDPAAVTVYWAEALSRGEPFEIEYRQRHADGRARWWNVRCKPLRNDADQVVRWYVAANDIDDRKKMEVALEERERELRKLVDTLPAYTWQASAAGVDTYSSASFLEYLGVSAAEYHTRSILSFVPPENREEIRTLWDRAVQSGTPYRAAIQLRRADGVYRWLETRANPLVDSAGRIMRWYGLSFDIDDSKRLEESLRSVQGRLARAMQISTVAELSASIAHEINQPLAAIVANGQACIRWLSGAPPNIDRARRSAEVIVRDGNSAAAVVQRVRSLFKQSPQERVVLNVNEVIGEVLRVMDDECRKKGVLVVTDLAYDLPRVVADRVSIQQILINLVQNAIDAMQSLEPDHRAIRVASASPEGVEVTVTVRDRGPGIPDAEQIFEPFYTTKQYGLGVGLSISRTMIESHRGRLWARNDGHPGATFGFTLPACIEAPVAG